MNGRPLRENELANNVLPRFANWRDSHTTLMQAAAVMDFLNVPAVSDAFTNARDRVQALLER